MKRGRKGSAAHEAMQMLKRMLRWLDIFYPIEKKNAKVRMLVNECHVRIHSIGRDISNSADGFGYDPRNWERLHLAMLQLERFARSNLAKLKREPQVSETWKSAKAAQMRLRSEGVKRHKYPKLVARKISKSVETARSYLKK
jgi:hypothetical protein